MSITLKTIRRYGPYGIWTQNIFCWNRSLLQHACKLYVQWKMRKFFVQGTMYSLFSYNRLFQNKIHTPYADLDLQLYQYMNIHLQQYIAQNHINAKIIPWTSQELMSIVLNKISNIRFWNTLPWYIVRQAQVCYLPLLNFNFLF